MMNKVFTSALFLCILSIPMHGQVNFLQGEDWTDAKQIATETGKPIFIDFYTTWCGPCKKMDKTTFADSAITHMLNDQFVSLKLDAEKEINKDLVQRFNIKAYPSSVFTNPRGELIAKEEGYKTAEEFGKFSEGVLSFIEEKVYSKISKSNISSFGQEELDNIVDKYKSYSFNDNGAIKAKYYNMVKNGQTLSTSGFNYILTQYTTDDDYDLLIDGIPEKKGFMDNVLWKVEFDKILSQQFNEAIIDGDRGFFDEVSNNFMAVHEKFHNAYSPSSETEVSKQIKSQTLAFYEKNGPLDQYYSLADTLINDYILTFDVDAVRKQDKLLSGISEGVSDNKLQAIDKLAMQNMNAYKMAKRLNEISEHIVLNTSDGDQLAKSLDWVDASLAYLDLPEGRIIKAAILKKMGKDADSKSEISEAKKSLYFDQDSLTKISKLGL